MKSNVDLASTIDGTLPKEYAFYNKSGRSFRAEYGSTTFNYSIVLFERTDKQDYEKCFARGLLTNLDTLAIIIDLWVDKQKDIAEIKNKFDELELYADFAFNNSNQGIDNAWTKVKNMFFNDTKFWKTKEWNERYIEMLNEAKRHRDFENLYPFTSHYWLRFSTDEDTRGTWSLNTYIIPTRYSSEVPRTLGKFYVSYNDVPLGGEYFETAKEALDLYSEKLKAVEPFKY